VKRGRGHEPRFGAVPRRKQLLDDDVQQKAERIDQDMALAPGDLLARIKPLRVKRGAPF
jgi:hypothetical protein